MSELPATLSLQQSFARPITGEELELFGKKAAAMYSTAGMNLTNAVVETVKHAGLGPEQVRRVAEFANIAAYLTEFQKCGSDHRYVQFAGGPADVPTILRDLNDGGGGTVFDRGLADYQHAPPDVAKLASRNLDHLGGADAKLAAAFGVTEVPLPFADPLKESYDLYTKLADAREVTAYELSVNEGAFREISAALYEQVKQAALQGTPLGHIVQAWSSTTDNPSFIKAAFQGLAPRFLQDQVFGSRDEIAGSLSKTASGMIVNPTNEMIGMFREYCEVLSKLAEARMVRDELTGALDELGGFLTKQIDKLAAADRAGDVAGALEHGAHAIHQGWDTATKATAAAAPTAQRIGEALAGPLAGRFAGGAVKYAPHIAAGLGAESAYQHARYSPTFQTAKNFALGRIPYTHPYMVRQYDLQMQGAL